MLGIVNHIKIDQIFPEDRLLLSRAAAIYHPQSLFYEDSWGYVMQATRYQGFKYYNADSDLLIFGGYKSPQDRTISVPVFFGDHRDVVKVLNTISQERNCRIILKNVSPSDVDSLCRYGLRKYTDGESWSPEAIYDDQTYPQVIVDLNELIPCHGRAYHKLTNLLNRVNLSGGYEMLPYSSTHKSEVINLIEEKDHQCSCNSNPYWEAHKMYLEDVEDSNRYVITEDGYVKGFIVTSSISSTATALCAALFRCGSKKDSAWGMYHVLVQEFQNGFKYANLGGSETVGVFEFKRQTFKPSMLIERTHLVWEPAGHETPGDF